jgi:acyl-CoA-binding protein
VHRLAESLRPLLLSTVVQEVIGDNEGNYPAFLNFRSAFAWVAVAGFNKINCFI